MRTSLFSDNVRPYLPYVSVKKTFRAVGDGVVNDKSAIDSASVAGGVFLPSGVYSYPGSDFGAALGSKRIFGEGIVQTGANKRARYFSAISAAPAEGNHASPDTAFNGDWSKSPFPVEHRITGANTLGQPTSDYKYTPEAYAHYGYLFNSSGYNHNTGGNDGRTAAVYSRVRVYQAGQGDAVAYNASVYVTGTRSGSTNFLANPAGSLFNGDITAGTAGVYLNPYEISLSDGGVDAAAAGHVINFKRTVNTAAKSAVWLGVRLQAALGTVACDNLFSATGKWEAGVDLTMSNLDFGTNKAAISLKADDRIYFNNFAGASGNLVAGWRTTTFNNTYLKYDSATSRIQMVVNGGAAATFHGTSAVNFALGVNVASGKTYQLNGQAVVGARNTGWTAMTGATDKDTAYDTSTITLQQLAQRVGFIQAALTSHGLLGA